MKKLPTYPKLSDAQKVRVLEEVQAIAKAGELRTAKNPK